MVVADEEVERVGRAIAGRLSDFGITLEPSVLRSAARATLSARSGEVERLHALAKANNTLARMNGQHRDEWRAKAVAAMEDAEALREAAESAFCVLDAAEYPKVVAKLRAALKEAGR